MKLEVNEYYNSLSNLQNSQIKFVLTEDSSKYLSQSNDYVKALMNLLRERHDLVYKLLKFCNCDEKKKKTGYNPKESFATLFTGSFYENILSSSFIETDLLIIFYLTLKNEISNLKHKPEAKDFLPEESINSYMIKGLIMKDDIKSYFKIILQSLIEAIDNREDNTILRLSQKELRNSIEKIKKNVLNDNKLKESRTYSGNDYVIFDNANSSQLILRSFSQDFIDPNEEEGINEYFENYTKKVLIKKMDKEKNNGVKNYIIKQLTCYEEDDGIFANDKFIENLLKGKHSTEIFLRYRKNFVIIKDFVDRIFQNLNNNIQIIPYSIKCISKMIAILIKKKDPTINVIDRNAFIASFFFEGLLKPMLTLPEINGSFTIFMTQETKKILLLVQKIIKKLVSGQFFTSSKEECDYTTFNKYFVDSMPNVLQFFDNLIDVKLPPFIEKFIEGNENEDEFIYNYFKENPNECIAHRSMCYSIEDVLEIINIIQTHKEEFFEQTYENKEQNSQMRESNSLFKKVFLRLSSCKAYIDLLNSLKEHDEKKKTRTHILTSEVQFSGQLKLLSNIDFTSQCLTLKEKKGSEKETNLLKCKNFLSQILFNFQELNQEIFGSSPINTTENILKSLQCFLTIDYYLFYNSIPLGWYGMSLRTLLKNIPPEYKENDFFKFYEELKKNVEDSINMLDIRELGKITCKMNYTRRALKNIQECVSKLKQRELNNQIQSYINNARIAVAMNRKLDFPKNQLTIYPVNQMDNFKTLNNFINIGNSKYKEQAILSIRDFIKKFPNFVEMQKLRDEEPFQLEQKLKVDLAIQTYFKLIQENLKKDPQLKKFYINGYKQINDYLMNTLYPKLYAEDPTKDDLKIFQQCVKLSWIEPNNIVNSKGLILDNFLQETVGYILMLDKVRSPLKKIGLIKKVSEVIQSTLIFSTGKQDNSIDDSLPLLQYAIIKAQPQRLASNAQYLELYLDEEAKRQEMGLLLSQLEVTVETLKNFSCQKLFDVTEEEFER